MYLYDLVAYGEEVDDPLTLFVVKMIKLKDHRLFPNAMKGFLPYWNLQCIKTDKKSNRLIFLKVYFFLHQGLIFFSKLFYGAIVA